MQLESSVAVSWHVGATCCSPTIQTSPQSRREPSCQRAACLAIPAAPPTTQAHRDRLATRPKPSRPRPCSASFRLTRPSESVRFALFPFVALDQEFTPLPSGRLLLPGNPSHELLRKSPDGSVLAFSQQVAFTLGEEPGPEVSTNRSGRDRGRIHRRRSTAQVAVRAHLATHRTDDQTVRDRRVRADVCRARPTGRRIPSVRAFLRGPDDVQRQWQCRRRVRDHHPIADRVEDPAALRPHSQATPATSRKGSVATRQTSPSRAI